MITGMGTDPLVGGTVKHLNRYMYLDKDGILYASYNNNITSAGPITPLTLCRLIDDGNSHSMYNNFCQGMELMNEGSKFMSFSTHYLFDWSQLYEVNKLSYFPYKVLTRLYQVKQPYVRTTQTLINMLNGKSVVRCFSENILVDVRTRRQKLLPYWFVDRYTNFKGVVTDIVSAKQALTRSWTCPEVPVSPSPFCLSVTVLENETDLNKFLYKDAFMRYSFECVDFACRQKRFPYLGETLSELNVSELSVCHHDDARVGDCLTVLCWQREQADALYCVIRKNASIIFTCKMTFDLSS